MEEQLLEVVEYQLRRTVLVALYLVEYDLYLASDFLRREDTVEGDVGKQLHRPGKVVGEESRIDGCLLLVREGVEVSPDALHPVQDVPGTTLLRPFEDKVLHEVRHALFVVRLVARPGIDGKASVCHGGSRWCLNDAQSVGQSMLIQFHALFVRIRFQPAKVTLPPTTGNGGPANLDRRTSVPTTRSSPDRILFL